MLGHSNHTFAAAVSRHGGIGNPSPQQHTLTNPRHDLRRQRLPRPQRKLATTLPQQGTAHRPDSTRPHVESRPQETSPSGRRLHPIPPIRQSIREECHPLPTETPAQSCLAVRPPPPRKATREVPRRQLPRGCCREYHCGATCK